MIYKGLYRVRGGLLAACVALCSLGWWGCASEQTARTAVTIEDDSFCINGEPTYKGRTWNGVSVEGLLMNSRMVQGIFDDLNPETASLFCYPDTKKWDAERNTTEFIQAMDSWRAHGLLAFTLNLQGGSPFGYGNKPVINSAFDEQGGLRPDYLARLERILDAADAKGMAVILGYFYFGQDQHLKDEKAILAATDNMTQWLLDKDYRHVLVEVANECDLDFYHHEILKAPRIHELMARIGQKTNAAGYRLPVSTSFSGGQQPTDRVLKLADFILLHGNGVEDPLQIQQMVDEVRSRMAPVRKPILFNEDDHYAFEKDTCNLTMAVRAYASWGFFDYRRENEGFQEGYQSMPADWGINSERKRSFFDKVKEITGF